MKILRSSDVSRRRRVKKNKHEVEVWADVQKIYKQPGKGFPDKALVVAYGRRRVD
jgi:hypothetical protein